MRRSDILTNSESYPVIELVKVEKSYGKLHALSGVDLSVHKGELYGFLGPNGAGKTTAIRIITGFIRSGAGTAKVFGLDAWRDAVEIKRRIGFLPDAPGMYASLTGQEFLDYLGHLSGDIRTSFQKELLDRLELSQGALARKIKGYSQGMRRKIAIVQAMQHEPELLIMDEPTNGLDPLIQQAFFEMVRNFRALGGTVFMSSHILSEVEELCERVAIIRDGVVVTTGGVDDLRAGRRRFVYVVFNTQAPAHLQSPGVEIVSREGSQLQLSVPVDLNPLIKELSEYQIKDIVFERPSLEEMFIDYYRHQSDSND